MAFTQKEKYTWKEISDVFTKANNLRDKWDTGGTQTPEIIYNDENKTGQTSRNYPDVVSTLKTGVGKVLSTYRDLNSFVAEINKINVPVTPELIKPQELKTINDIIDKALEVCNFSCFSCFTNCFSCDSECNSCPTFSYCAAGFDFGSCSSGHCDSCSMQCVSGFIYNGCSMG